VRPLSQTLWGGQTAKTGLLSFFGSRKKYSSRSIAAKWTILSVDYEDKKMGNSSDLLLTLLFYDVKK
jgi:hypothetical protein